MRILKGVTLLCRVGLLAATMTSVSMSTVSAVQEVIEAASCSEAVVRDAINAASDGYIVTIPAGEATWSERVVVDKEITVRGNTTGCPDEPNDGTIIKNLGFDIQANNVRVTAFTFIGDGSGACLRIGKIHNYRIDHNRFTDFSQLALFKNYGLIDHNLIEDCTGEVIDVKGNGNQSWIHNGTGGEYADGTVYIEDNIFDLKEGNGSNALDSNEGARWVFRHNTVNETGGFYGNVLESHGHFWGERNGPDNAGTYLQEVYGNTFNSGDARNWGCVLRSRGGRVLLYDNTCAGPGWKGGAVTFWNKESTHKASRCEVVEHQRLGIHELPWDTRELGIDDYPCPLQTNNLYVWGNSPGFKVRIEDGGKKHILEDRDYWDDIGDGDTNFKKGTSRPATCVVNDVYWETDTRKLYRCIAPNVWSLVYEPYPYPHPLTGEL